MRDEMLLLTVLQISDVHFGDTLGGDNADGLSAKVPPLLSTFRHLEGLLGHHYKGLSALHDFYSDLWENESGSGLLLVLTGDVTASGAPIQFDIADGFLGAFSPNSAFGFGLGRTDWRLWSISGNHDCWPGNGLPLGAPSAALKNYFAEPFPIVRNPIKLNNGTEVRFIFVDSDADVGPHGMNRLLARGHFVSQLTTLEKMLPRCAENEFRILAIHHSITRAGAAVGEDTITLPQLASGGLRTLEITPSTLRVLENALVDLNIKVVLCGHLHIPRLTRIVASNGTERTTVLEARCGSTTQVDKYPYKVLQRLDRSRNLAPNSLIVHKVVEVGSSTVWRSQIYWRSREGRFVRHNQYVSSLMPSSLASEIVVLPRD